jgi:hypothetical protein
MDPIFQFVEEVIEASRETYCAIADDIWDHPETRFEEFWSARRLADALEAEGFQLTRDAGGIPNAFIASVGEGQPVIALLGEFDALAGLSQQAHCAEPTSSTPGATVTAAGTICSGQRLSPRRLPPKNGCSSTAARAPCASTVARGRRRLGQNVHGARRAV